METNKLVAGIVATAIAVIVLAGVLMPALNNATETHTTFKNDGYYRMAEFDDTASFTAKWDHTDPNAFTVDGVRYDLPTTQQTIDPNLMCSENFFIRYNQTSSYAYVQGYGDTFGGAYVARSDQNQDMNITVSSGSIVFDNGSGTTKTVAYTTMYAINDKGEFILKHPTDTAYVNGDSTKNPLKDPADQCQFKMDPVALQIQKTSTCHCGQHRKFQI